MVPRAAVPATVKVVLDVATFTMDWLMDWKTFSDDTAGADLRVRQPQ